MSQLGLQIENTKCPSSDPESKILEVRIVTLFKRLAKIRYTWRFTTIETVRPDGRSCKCDRLAFKCLRYRVQIPPRTKIYFLFARPQCRLWII